MAIDTTLEQVEALYVGYFGRAGEPDGVNYWVGQLNSGYTVSDMAASFAVQAEAKAEYPFLATPNIITDPTAFINAVYQNLFGRAPDADGLNYWTGQLLSRGGDSHAIGQFILDVISGAQGADVTTLDNKAAAAEYYTQQLAADGIGGTHLDANGHGVLDANLVASADGAISGVTSDSATVTASEHATDAFIAGGGAGGVGQTFTLTTAIGETIHGTAGNDTFNAIIDGAAPTLNNFDTITDTGGVDTLHILSAGATALPAGAAISGVENIDWVFSAAPGTAIHANNFAGSTHIDISGSHADVDGINGQVVTYHGVSLTGVGNVANLTAAAGASSLTMGLDNVTDNGEVVVHEAHAGDLTSLTVNGSVGSTGSPPATSTFTIALGVGADAPTHVDTIHLGITSNSSIAIVPGSNTITTVDASASTGNLGSLGATQHASFFNLSGLALEHFTGGSGSDNVDVNINLAKAATFDGGAGNDVFHIGDPGGGSAVVNTFSGGAGSDTFDFLSLANIKDPTHLANSLDTISDFNATQDVLDLTNMGGVRGVLDNTQLANIASAATLELAVKAAAADIAGVASIAIFDYQGSAYVFHDVVGGGTLDAGDGLIQLVGVHTADLGATSLHV